MNEHVIVSIRDHEKHLNQAQKKTWVTAGAIPRLSIAAMHVEIEMLEILFHALPPAQKRTGRRTFNSKVKALKNINCS